MEAVQESSTIMQKCYSCGKAFPDWRQLARHVLNEHPDSMGARWSRDYVRRNTNQHWYRDNRSEESHYETSRSDPKDGVPLQKQAIEVLAKLYAANVSEGEIQAMVNLAKRKAKK